MASHRKATIRGPFLLLPLKVILPLLFVPGSLVAQAATRTVPEIADGDNA